MRKTNQEGVELIKYYEGFSAKPYLCAAGFPTIGYGHLIKKGEKFGIISMAEAEELLRQDMASAERSVLRLIERPLTDNQFAALVSFTFNLGGGALQASTLRRKVNAGLDSEVPEQFMRWIYAGGRKLKGLERRRGAEAEVYAS